MDSYINIIGNVSMFILLIFVIFCLKKSWESEKKDRIDREKKIENMYNEIMGINEK